VPVPVEQSSLPSMLGEFETTGFPRLTAAFSSEIHVSSVWKFTSASRILIYV
jgi:hypothetical protein